MKKEIFKIINFVVLLLSCVICNMLGKCLVYIFGLGDRKLLFEMVNELVGIILGGKFKIESENRMRYVVVVCLGDIYGVVGDSVIGLY